MRKGRDTGIGGIMRKRTDCRECRYMKEIYPSKNKVTCKEYYLGHGSFSIGTVERLIPRSCPKFKARLG